MQHFRGTFITVLRSFPVSLDGLPPGFHLLPTQEADRSVTTIAAAQRVLISYKTHLSMNYVCFLAITYLFRVS